MNDLSGYKNNILYITNDTKLSKIVGNSSYNSNKVKNTIYKKIYSNNFLNISKEKQTNSEYSNKIFSCKPNIKILTTHQRILTYNNNQDKAYSYKCLPRKNIMHIKTSTSEKKIISSTAYSPKKYINNISISYTTPKKNTSFYCSNCSNVRKNKGYFISESSHAKTASSSYKKLEAKNKFSTRNNIKVQNLIPKFNEEIKNKKRIITYKLDRVKENTKSTKDNNSINTINKIKIIDQIKEDKLKKKEQRERNIANLLRNVSKIKCTICHKLLNHYLYQMHYSFHPSQIFPWLYLGDYMNANNNEELKFLNIKYILNCAFEIKISNIPSGIKYLKLDLIDSPEMNIVQYFEEAFAFIESARKNNDNILIHCKLGRSRSVSILIAYMIRYYNFNVKKAMEFIKAKRKQIKPNYGFIKQLYSYERYIKNINNIQNMYYTYNNNYICW